MKCAEIQPLHGAYLDSELDAKTTLEIQQHLAECPDCTRAFAAEAKLSAQITTGLRRGQRTATLWEQIEQQVVTAAVNQPPSPLRELTFAATFRLRLRELLWPSPQAWAGLAAVWVVLLVTSFMAREPATATEARQVSPPSRQTRELLQEQRQMLAELNGLADQLATEQPGGVAPQPHTQRSEQPSNT